MFGNNSCYFTTAVALTSVRHQIVLFPTATLLACVLLLVFSPPLILHYLPMVQGESFAGEEMVSNKKRKSLSSFHLIFLYCGNASAESCQDTKMAEGGGGGQEPNLQTRQGNTSHRIRKAKRDSWSGGRLHLHVVGGEQTCMSRSGTTFHCEFSTVSSSPSCEG